METMHLPRLPFETYKHVESVYISAMDRINAQALVRFGLGASQADKPDADPRGALRAQLQGPDPGLASGAFDGLPTGLDAMDAQRADDLSRKAFLAAGKPAGAKPVYQRKALYQADLDAQIGWAVRTTASFRERLVWFYANHFSVSVLQGNTFALVGPMIREAIRPHVNGNFTDMVLAAERHPAMLRYLDNEASVGPDSDMGIRTGKGLNENLGRECMELHTVGLAAGYTQTDVTNMAKILTGWSVAPAAGGGDATGFKYRPAAHEPGPQTVLGYSFDGGEQAGIDALTFLSRHPSAYRLLAAKLVTHFVADNPPEADIARIAAVLTDTGGDLLAAANTLVDLQAAWQPMTKLKTPQEFLVSTLRAAPAEDGQPIDYAGISGQLGQAFWAAPLPNGWPDQAASWDGSDAILSRVDWAYTYAGRFNDNTGGPQPADIAQTALGGLLRPATAQAIDTAGSRREALTLLFAAPEFQRR
jgi:uncharacterized protein (DUF1800 family)